MSTLNPADLLRANHRQLLDRRAELQIEARQLGQRVNEVATELEHVTRELALSTALIKALRPREEDA